jgi:hypothetical protein
MNNDDFLEDDFLRDLIRQSPLDSPSDGFTGKVMENIQPVPALVPAGRPFFLFLRSAWPYALAAAVLIVFFMTSDLPFTQFMPGKEYFSGNLVPYFQSLFSGMGKLLFHSTYTSFALIVLASSGLLLVLDRIFRRKISVPQHHVFL